MLSNLEATVFARSFTAGKDVASGITDLGLRYGTDGLSGLRCELRQGLSVWHCSDVVVKPGDITRTIVTRCVR